MAWQRSTNTTIFNAPKESIAVYSAVVGLDIEVSTLEFNPGLEARELAAAIEMPPEWSLNSWPPQRSSNPDDDLVLFALAKLKALFDFSAQLPDGSAEQIKQAVAARFPVTAVKEPGVVDYKRFSVRATIWEDGTATWGYEIPAAGNLPEAIQNGKERDLDIFLQNVVRYDLQKRIEALYTSS